MDCQTDFKSEIAALEAEINAPPEYRRYCDTAAREDRETAEIKRAILVCLARLEAAKEI